MQAHLFGSIEVDAGDHRLDARSFGGRKSKQVLEILLVAGGRPVPADELAGLLWPLKPPSDYAATVQHYVSVLRRRLPRCPVNGSPVLSTRNGYLLEPGRFTLDLDRFDAAEAAADVAPVGRRRALLAQALELVRGDVLADEPAAPWAAEVRTRYRRAHVRLLLQASAAALSAAEPATARDLATLAVAQDPHAEPAAGLLMAAHYAVGNRLAALAAFEHCRQGLSDALGVDPMPLTVDMQRAVLRRAPVSELEDHALRMTRAHVPCPATGRLPVSA